MHHHHDRGIPQFIAARHRGDFGPLFGFGPPGRFGKGRSGHAGRVPRGDVRAAILLLVSERPMHGYEIIAELEERTEGLWRPSPGSIYPTLSFLEDEGLVVSKEEDGKRRFSITSAGTEQIADRGDVPPPWDEVTANADPTATGLRESATLLFAALAQVGRAGTPQQATEAVSIVDEARRRLYSLLADS